MRTGTKIAFYELDSLILLSQETFDQTSIRQIGMFGYNEQEATYFSIGSYNIDIGPHVKYGSMDSTLDRIMFMENDSSRYFLNLVSENEYYWTYENLNDGEWEPRDLKIIFKRE